MNFAPRLEAMYPDKPGERRVASNRRRLATFAKGFAVYAC